MGIVIPFKNDNYNPLLEDSDEIQILSDKHKCALRKRLTFLTRVVTEKDFPVIQSETFKKLESVRSSRKFVNKMQLRIKLLYQMLFDTEFNKSRTTLKTAAAGLLYFISDGDFISDDIPGLGFLDDAYIIRQVWERAFDELRSYVAFRGLDEKLYL